MYISYNWLKDFLKIPARVKPEEIAEQLTNHTVEVEGIAKQAERFRQVVIGQVLEVDKHPNADRLRVTLVDIKNKKLKIVCGAPNVAPGQMVPVALVGATLPNGAAIQETEIRGVVSSGMICAEDELGLGNNHEGIMVLDSGAKIGESFAKYLHADDIVLEVDNKSLSNRPDLWSHYGLARELSAIFGWALKPYNKLLDKFVYLSDKDNKLEVKVDDKETCPRYQAIQISELTVQESPAWLKERLIAAQQRPVNNIVDLTNYVMLECGQPLHAFDADKVKKILVRRASKNEAIETLDGRERHLDGNDLVITDGRSPIAIAGVMGGANSEISVKTSQIILEAANFKAAAIRKTAQKIGLRSEASMRFEKALDPELTELAIRRFLTLLKDICPKMKIASTLVDINNALKSEIVIDLDLIWLDLKIGQAIPHADSRRILEKLGFSVAEKEENLWRVTVPSWRATRDVKAREDIAEEILRLYGYDNIAAQLPVQIISSPVLNSSRKLEREIKHLLSAKYSLSEAYNYSFVSEDQLKKLGIDFSNHLRLANPLSDIQTILRQSLVPGLLSNVKVNQAKATSLGFFEIGSVFFNTPGNFHKEASGTATLPYQEKRLGLVLADDNQDLFGRLKGLVVSLLRDLSLADSEVEFAILENKPGWADCRLVANIILNGQEVGLIAQVGPAASGNLNLKKPAAVAEINFDRLVALSLGRTVRQFQAGSKYPPIVRDLAFVVNEKIMYNDLRRMMMNFNPLLIRVELFDVYSGNKLLDGEKSLAFHLTYQSPEKTLTAGEVDTLQAELAHALAAKFEARLRDF
ncbi:MAG: phenylalanine--tRNA ligase subunit beta [Patescibacteria group bacterium]|jgi:phenylalanyl-tRNA synthetase beta chain